MTIGPACGESAIARTGNTSRDDAKNRSSIVGFSRLASVRGQIQALGYGSATSSWQSAFAPRMRVCSHPVPDLRGPGRHYRQVLRRTCRMNYAPTSLALVLPETVSGPAGRQVLHECQMQCLPLPY